VETLNWIKCYSEFNGIVEQICAYLNCLRWVYSSIITLDYVDFGEFVVGFFREMALSKSVRLCDLVICEVLIPL
jgi:hypothetical protein